MEIERKYLVAKLPDQLETYPCRLLEQGYLNTNPVVRIRRDNEKYELTYKSAGLMSRQEYNLPLDRESYHHLLGKIDDADSFTAPGWFGEDVTFSGKYHNSYLSRL